jgi:AAA+ ATPase superfamily predicted ATPase
MSEKKEIIGREGEIQILQRLLQSKQPELLAIYGRRRVGKTFLIRECYRKNMAFSCIGQHNGKTREQLANFTQQLNLCFPARRTLLIPSTWQEAFVLLRDNIETVEGNGKKVIFFDELPWLDTHKSGFLSAFGYFWNSYASTRADLLVVICGSAASWIIDKVVNSKGGLHNRITQRIRLLPFTLSETLAYLKHRNINLNLYQVIQLYMVMGGVPAYLAALERGLSADQNIANCCFTKDGVLVNEFDNLYSALFNNPDNHIEIIRALARKNKGLTRSEVLSAGKLFTGGTITTVLKELEESGFIERTYPFGRKEKDSLYRLTDEFSLFYLRFMDKRINQGAKSIDWPGAGQTQTYVAWCGYAFENICLKHITQIKKALQIGGVHTSVSSWIQQGSKNSPGAQIDLLIDRADNCINICEMKYSTTPFLLDKKYAESLQNKVQIFRQATKTKKTLFLTFVTTYGVADNDYKTQRVDAEVTMDALFHQ